MAAPIGQFENWLTEKLLSLNPDTDTEVFSSYISGILEEDGEEDEKREAVIGLIDQVVDSNQNEICDEFFTKWEELTGQMSENAKTESSASDELTEHLAHILEAQKIEAVQKKDMSEEEKARKEAILAQYGHISSGEDDDEDDGGKGDANEDLLAFKNVNAEQVKKNELELREKSKQEAEKKREKDKQDREVQKQKEKDRKDTEKKRTQKGEKRR